MEVKHNAGIVLLRIDHFFIVRIDQESKSYAVSTERRLNNVRNILLPLRIIKIRHILTGHILMLCQIVIGTVGNPPEFPPSKWE